MMVNLRRTGVSAVSAMISPTENVIIVVAFLLMAGLLLLVHKTKLGRAMRAVAEKPNNAAPMGVSPNFTISARGGVTRSDSCGLLVESA